jgi:hypothetical protein
MPTDIGLAIDFRTGEKRLLGKFNRVEDTIYPHLSETAYGSP